MTGRDHRAEIKFCPAVAPQAVGLKIVLMPVQAGEGAKVDHLVTEHRGRLVG